jgi:hypothetical protein
MVKGKGWYNEPLRHSLARKGVKTASKKRLDFPLKKDFKKGDHLPIHTAITVPSTKEGDVPVSKEEHRRRAKEVAKKLSGWFGGYTEVEARGGWVEKGRLIKEPVYVVHAFAERDKYYEHDAKLQKYIESKQKEWGQFTIAFQYEDDLFFVEKKKKTK